MYVLSFEEIDRTKFMVVGGKGANLGELSRIREIQVPEGFCVTTEAYKKVTENNQELKSLLDELGRFKAEERDHISAITAKIRFAIERIPIAQDIAEEIAGYLTKFGEEETFAVRSSATAEDLPTASFAGQHDTYLNIIGKELILTHISKCWASLFTERAVIYRLQNGFDHRKVHLAVVVQKMVLPQVAGTTEQVIRAGPSDPVIGAGLSDAVVRAGPSDPVIGAGLSDAVVRAGPSDTVVRAGILFTADPVTANRKVVSIDASFGLGEAMVSGLVNADNYKVCNSKIIDKKISRKQVAIYALNDGGTKEQEIEPELQNRQALTDAQILQLEHIGRKIEEHFGSPQDIEWCLVDDTFYMVQSRPITTLFPIPAPSGNDEENRVYVSVGHQQMMTDAMKPLGLSFYLLTTPAPMRTAGGRLFVDVTAMLASPATKQTVIDNLGKSDPLIKDALTTIVERRDFIKPLPDDKKAIPGKPNKEMPSSDLQAQIEADPKIVSDLIRRSQTSIEELKQNIQTKSGSDLFDFIREDIQQLKKILFDPQSHRVFMAAMDASSWINEKMKEWLGEKNAADILSQSAPNNITSEMALVLLDVADVIRPYREVIDYLQHLKGDDFLDELDFWTS